MNGEQQSDKRTISGEQVAILAERIDVLLQNFSKTEGMLLTMSGQMATTTQQMAVFQERMTQSAENMRRLFNIADEHGESLEKGGERLDVIDKKVEVQSWAWKLFGTCVILSLGLVGWTFKELQNLNKSFAEQASELRLLSYMITNRGSTGPTGPAGPPGPTGAPSPTTVDPKE